MNYAGITVIADCVFYNTFGRSGGAISMTEGGALFA